MIQSIWKKKLILVVMALCVTCFCMGCGQQKAQEPADRTQTEISQETTEWAEPEQTEAAIDRDGSYDSKDEVALYLYTYGELPDNYITKKEARSLGWDGGKKLYGYVDDIPRYADVKVGDCIETNGYSEIFPPGIFIGRVTRIDDAPDGQSYRLIVNLGIDFANLRNVNVIASSFRAEVDTLRNHAAIIDGSAEEKKP